MRPSSRLRPVVASLLLATAACRAERAEPRPGRAVPAQAARPTAAPAGGDPKAKEAEREGLRKVAVLTQRQALALKRPESAASFLKSAQAARALRDRFAPLNAEELNLIPPILYNEACTLALGGEGRRAVRVLEEAYDLGFDQLGYLDADADLDPIRNLPEFHALQARLERRQAEAARANFRPFPFDFRLPDLDGKPVGLDSYRGKVTLVIIGGTWCVPARKLYDHLAELARRFARNGLELVGLQYEGDADKPARDAVRAYARNHPLAFRPLIGDAATRRKVPDFVGYPTTLLIDRGGKVRRRLDGYQPLATLEAAVAVLLEASPGPAAGKATQAPPPRGPAVR